MAVETITLKEASELLGVGPDTVKQFNREGKFSRHGLGTRLIFPKAEVEAFLLTSKKELAAKLLAEVTPPKANGTPAPRKEPATAAVKAVPPAKPGPQVPGPVPVDAALWAALTSRAALLRESWLEEAALLEDGHDPRSFNKSTEARLLAGSVLRRAAESLACAFPG